MTSHRQRSIEGIRPSRVWRSVAGVSWLALAMTTAGLSSSPWQSIEAKGFVEVSERPDGAIAFVSVDLPLDGKVDGKAEVAFVLQKLAGRIGITSGNGTATWEPDSLRILIEGREPVVFVSANTKSSDLACSSGLTANWWVSPRSRSRRKPIVTVCFERLSSRGRARFSGLNLVGSSCYLPIDEKGYSRVLSGAAISQSDREPIFATTRLDNVAMQKVLENLGLRRLGDSWQSDRGGKPWLVLYVTT